MGIKGFQRFFLFLNFRKSTGSACNICIPFTAIASFRGKLLILIVSRKQQYKDIYFFLGNGFFD
jgi:hypothetical protein